MNNNEYQFAKDIVNLDKDITYALKYVKENYNVNAVYDEEENQINLSVENVNESLNLMAAKEYIDNTFKEGFITTNIL